VVAGNLDKKVPYGALGFVNAMTDLGDYTSQGGTLYVFALPTAHTNQAGREPARQSAR
jgi:alcohol dehydrogenase (cytochrome c)